MMLVKNILLFQKKILPSSYAIAIVLGFIFGSIKFVGIAFMFILPLVHLLVYELQSKNEYFYYYNLGITKLNLWLSTVILGLINISIFLFI